MAEQPNGGRVVGIRGAADSEDGAALTEFALVSVLFFTVVFAIIQGGIIFGSWIIVANAAREAARYASPCISRAELSSPAYCAGGDWTSTTAIQSTVEDYTRNKIPWPNPADPAFDMQFNVTYDLEGSPSPRLVRVLISYSVPLLAPLPAVVIPNPLPLAIESDMRIES